jgi:hypothetical protein
VFILLISVAALSMTRPAVHAQAPDNTAPPGFTSLFNGKDLTGWQALLDLPTLKFGVGLNPADKAKLSPEELDVKQRESNAKFLPHWQVVDGVITYDGKGQNLQTVKEYGNIELLVDWKIPAGADTGLYLRGTPQVQIWDRPIGSGGLFNNKVGLRNPIKKADRPIGEWNTFRIIQQGDVTTIWLNGELIVDKVVMENFWDYSKPLAPRGTIELQHHGSALYFKNIYVKELN